MTKNYHNLLLNVCMLLGLGACSNQYIDATDNTFVNDVHTEYINAKLVEYKNELPEGVHFYENCDDVIANPTKIMDLDIDKLQLLDSTLNEVVYECKKLSERFPSNTSSSGIFHGDCDTCISQEAKKCANASRKYIDFITHTSLLLQYINMDNFFEKFAEIQIKCKNICLDRQSFNEQDSAFLNDMHKNDMKLIESKQSLQKMYNFAKEAQNLDQCGSGCVFIIEPTILNSLVAQ